MLFSLKKLFMTFPKPILICHHWGHFMLPQRWPSLPPANTTPVPCSPRRPAAAPISSAQCAVHMPSSSPARRSGSALRGRQRVLRFGGRFAGCRSCLFRKCVPGSQIFSLWIDRKQAINWHRMQPSALLCTLQWPLLAAHIRTGVCPDRPQSPGYL